MKAVFKVKFESEAQIKTLTKALSQLYGCAIRPRGRHTNRKSVLGGAWHPGTQNDIPWRKAETVSFYLINR